MAGQRGARSTSDARAPTRRQLARRRRLCVSGRRARLWQRRTRLTRESGRRWRSSRRSPNLVGGWRHVVRADSQCRRPIGGRRRVGSGAMLQPSRVSRSSVGTRATTQMPMAGAPSSGVVGVCEENVSLINLPPHSLPPDFAFFVAVAGFYGSMRWRRADGRKGTAAAAARASTLPLSRLCSSRGWSSTSRTNDDNLRVVRRSSRANPSPLLEATSKPKMLMALARSPSRRRRRAHRRSPAVAAALRVATPSRFHERRASGERHHMHNTAIVFASFRRGALLSLA